MKYSFLDIEAFASRFYGGSKLLITPYAYNITFLALAQNTSATQTLNIAANADFIFLSARTRAQIGAPQDVGIITAPFVRMLLIDSGSGEQFTQQPVDILNYGGNPTAEHNLPYPRIIAGKSTLTVTVTNYAPTAETYTSLDVMLEGVQVRAYNG